MTLPKNVADAMRIISVNENQLDELRPYWQTIRAHLMSQEAEIERLRESTHYANGVADLAMKHRDLAESGLAAANALLRECHCYFEARGVDSRTIGESLSLNEKIQSHLQGAGDE